MLAFSTVFALPFFVLAVAPQLVSRLPRAGGWMNSIKVAMGFLEVAAAMKFISNVDLIWKWGIFTRSFVLAIWIAIGIILAVYLLGKFQLSHDSKPERIGAIRLTCGDTQPLDKLLPAYRAVWREPPLAAIVSPAKRRRTRSRSAAVPGRSTSGSKITTRPRSPRQKLKTSTYFSISLAIPARIAAGWKPIFLLRRTSRRK